jgi:alkaline phosphatase
MSKTVKKLLSCIALFVLILTGFFSGLQNQVSKAEAQNKNTEISKLATQTTAAPKYVFFFIGDGMSYPQIQAASDYLGATKQPKNATILTGNEACHGKRRIALV